MGEEIAVENGRISDFQRLVTLTLDRDILHTIMHHSSTSTQTPNFIEIEETFCGRRDVRTYVWTNVRTGGRTFETTLLVRLGGVDLKTTKYYFVCHFVAKSDDLFLFIISYKINCHNLVGLYFQCHGPLF